MPSFKTLFSKMLVKSKDLFDLVMPHHYETDAINKAQFPPAKTETEFIGQIIH
jgi:hypothetical protein